MLEKYVVIKYLRISIEDGDKPESDSIENQRYLLDYNVRKLFADKDVEIIEIVDDGYTGTNMNRPGMKKLLILCETREVNCIIVKDFSRFARDYIDVGTYVDKKFPLWNIRFVSVNDGYDSINFGGITGGIDMALKNITYTMYSYDLSEKVKSARKTLYKKGKFLSPYAIYGYLKSPEDKRKLVIDPVASVYVKRMFEMRASGIPLVQIANIFNKEKILTPAMYKKTIDPLCRNWNNTDDYNYWTSRIVGNILRDERYTGKNISGKYERMIVGSKKLRPVEKENRIVVENAFEPIVSQELFDSVYTIIKRSNHAPEAKISLQGIVRCGGCRHVLSPTNKSGTRHKFFCRYKTYTEESNCFQGYIGEGELLEFVSKLVIRALERNVDIQKAEERIRAKFNQNKKAIDAIIKKIEKEKRKKLDDYILLTKGEIEEEEFVKRRVIIDNNINEYLKQERELRSETMSKEDIQVTELFGQYTDKENLNREVLQDLIKAVYIYSDNRIEVVWNYKEPIS